MASAAFLRLPAIGSRGSCIGYHHLRNWQNRSFSCRRFGGIGKPPNSSKRRFGDASNDFRSGRMLTTQTMDTSGSPRLAFDRDNALYARFVSYNVLSSSLASPSHFDENDPEALDEENRLQKLLAKLEREIAFGSIISLQEVSMKWSGPLHAFFAKQGYHLVFSGYGHFFNGYMGIAIAFPLREYDLLDASMVKPSDTKPWPSAPKPEKSGFEKAWDNFRYSKIGKVFIEPEPRPPETGYSYSKKRHNSLIFMRLKARKNGKVFCVANYHMPCAYFLPDTMTIHMILALGYLKNVMGSDPLIFCGDFNVAPDSPQYSLVTEGKIAEDHEPMIPAHDPWEAKPALKLLSAYKVFTGSEPDFTNFAKIKDKPVFINTLDYIFITPGLEVVDVEALPSRDDVAGPFPNEEEPSDHILIAATIRMSSSEDGSVDQKTDQKVESSAEEKTP